MFKIKRTKLVQFSCVPNCLDLILVNIDSYFLYYFRSKIKDNAYLSHTLVLYIYTGDLLRKVLARHLVTRFLVAYLILETTQAKKLQLDPCLLPNCKS